MSINFKIKPFTPNHKKSVEKYYRNHGNYHEGDAGLDLFCMEEHVVPAMTQSYKIPLGISVAAYVEDQPRSFYLYPRSSTGAKTPLRLSNSVGIIDQGYRGELVAMVDNNSTYPFVVSPGSRYFQICAGDLRPVTFELVGELSETTRGTGGFGSTDKSS